MFPDPTRKEGELTDMDIDKLLESGEQRTMEQQEKLVAMGGSSLRTFTNDNIEDEEIIGNDEPDPDSGTCVGTGAPPLTILLTPVPSQVAPCTPSSGTTVPRKTRLPPAPRPPATAAPP